MATVNNSSSSTNSFYNALGIKNKGIGGLASGLDTDSLVEALTSATKSKIMAQSQKKQLLNWKITGYRTMSTALKAYQDKYLSNTNMGNNLMSNTFFNTYKATSSSSKVTATANGNSILGDFTIDKVAQLASAETLTNKSKLSTDLTLGVNFNTAFSENMFTGRVLQLDDGSGTPKNIKLDSLNQYLVEESGRPGVYNLDATKATQIKNTLQDLMTDAFGTKNVYNSSGIKTGTVSKVQVSFTEDGKFKLDSDTSKISVYSNCDVLNMTQGKSNRVNMNDKLGSIGAFAGVQGDVLSFTINGTEITVTKNDTLKTLKSKIDSSAAGVRFDYNEFTDEFKLTAKNYGSGNNIDIRDTQGNLMNTMFGAESGGGVGTNWLMSKDTPTGDSIMALFAGTGVNMDAAAILKNLNNLEFSLTIDGVTKTVKADTSQIDSAYLTADALSASNILSAINKGIQNAFEGTSVRFAFDYEDTVFEGVDVDGNPTSTPGIQATGKVTLTGADGVAFAANATTSGSRNALEVLGVTSGSIGNTVFDMGYNTSITATNQVDGRRATTLNGERIGGNISGTFDLTINGVTKQIEVFDYDDASLNSAIKKAFGSDIARKVNFSYDGGKLKLNIADSNMSVNVGHGVNIGDKIDIYEALGFTGTGANNVSLSGGTTTFADLKKGDLLNEGALVFTLADGSTAEVRYGADSDLQGFLAAINYALGDPAAASIVDGRLSIKSANMKGVADYATRVVTDGDDNPVLDEETGLPVTEITSNAGSMLKNFFGIKADESGNFKFNSAEKDYNVYNSDGSIAQDSDGNDLSRRKAGNDAEIIVDGKTLSYSSNTFTLNGTTITINEVSGAGDAPINIGVKSDPEDVVKRLKDWIADYNGVVSALNSMIYEGKSKGYEPLTDEQKSQMTNDQIKEWESEAKKGILRNDQTLAKIVSDMRSALYSKVESAGISLYDIGITTKSYSYTDLSQAGHLEISDENKLRSMLEKDPDKVRLLFTDPNEGLATKMNTIITAATNTSSVNRGSLVNLAGTEMLTGNNTSVLGNQIDQIDKYITTLTARMKSEYDRYWKQFSALETAISKMNSQSSWLSQS